MKKAILIFGLVIISVISATSQTNNCVIQVVEHKNHIYAYMDPQDYTSRSNNEKISLINNLAQQYNTTVVCVIYAHNSELWRSEHGTMKKVDSWDLDSINNQSTPKKKENRRSLQHPWFFNLSCSFNYYVGGSVLNPTSTEYTTINAYCRFGFFMLKGRWDLAVNGMVGFIKADEENPGNLSYTVGADTRVYILKGKIINPFLGIGVSYAFGENVEPSVTIPFSAGISIPISSETGCFDISYQYNNVTKSMFMFGYTVTN